MLRPITIAAAALSTALLAACANEPTFGEQLQTRGSAVGALGDQWVEGNAKVARGEDLVEKGRKQIEKGQASVRRGETLISEGRRQMATAETGYGQVTAAQQ